MSDPAGKILIATDPSGRETFRGVVNSEEDRVALPDRLREKLQRLESGKDLDFELEWEQDGGSHLIRGVPVTIEYAPGIGADAVSGTGV